MKNSVVWLVFMLWIMAWQTKALAPLDNEMEHHYLGQVVKELERLMPLLEEAKTARSPYQRFHFDYPKFIDHLHTLKQGIGTHITKSKHEPRRIVPFEKETL